MTVTWIDEDMRIRDMEITDEFALVEMHEKADSVARRLRDLGEHGVVLVSDGEGGVVGYISGREIVDRVAEGKDPLGVKAERLMSTDYMEISGEERLGEVVPIIAKEYPDAIVVIDFDGSCIGYFSKADYRDALAGLGCYDQTHDPVTPEEWLTKGIAMSSTGKRAEALECFENYIMVHPNKEKAWFQLARKFEKERQLRDAAICYDKYLSINSNDLDAWFNLGNVQAKQRNYAQALRSFNKALKIDPNNKNVLLNMGMSLTDAGKHIEALKAYDKLEQVIGVNPDLLYKKGNVHDKAGDQKKAVRCYKQAVSLNPGHEEAWFNQGAALHVLGKEKKAIKCFKEVIRLNPHNGSAKEAITICEESKGFLFF